MLAWRLGAWIGWQSATLSIAVFWLPIVTALTIVMGNLIGVRLEETGAPPGAPADARELPQRKEKEVDS